MLQDLERIAKEKDMSQLYNNAYDKYSKMKYKAKSMKYDVENY